MKVRFLDSRITKLEPAKEGDVGMDLRACNLYDSGHSIGGAPIGAEGLEKINLYPGAVVKIGTGIAICQDITWAAIYARSGLGCKGVRPRNGTGVIDTSYQGELIVCLENAGTEAVTINPLDRIAQLVLHHRCLPQVEVVSAFDTTTERGAGGFGSTGTT
jgi:dUTP pyrophosphatase